MLVPFSGVALEPLERLNGGPAVVIVLWMSRSATFDIWNLQVWRSMDIMVSKHHAYYYFQRRPTVERVHEQPMLFMISWRDLCICLNPGLLCQYDRWRPQVRVELTWRLLERA